MYFLRFHTHRDRSAFSRHRRLLAAPHCLSLSPRLSPPSTTDQQWPTPLSSLFVILTFEMEESEKIREWLKMMRMEASQGGIDNIPESLGIPSHGLSNPLIEGETATPANYASPRFDYYTDPMAALSANKRSSPVSHQAPQQYYNTPPRPRHPEMTHSPAYQDRSLNSPGQRMFQAPRAYHNYGPVRSPSASPSGRNPQSTWGAPSGAFNYSCSSNLPRGSNFMSPGFGQGGTPNFIYGRGRGLRYNSSPSYGSGHGASPYPDSGRSRGRSSGYNSTSPRSGQRGRRGASLHSPVSAELRPDLYYNHEMIEDPWKELNPVISNSQKFRTQILRNRHFQNPLA